ncbi:uncharacterized protein LOC130648067 [Hydractinia symbiolongicarpus]|uniref:uncharacterized protein LOC130648067 n=1 Tax=Hydractinia symbiolongicarpus TaxID=13093 RepID=UPI00254A5082|nr:uncharacterized protein LOC130648067 [Hydractinia symbiolongicarpus]
MRNNATLKTEDICALNVLMSEGIIILVLNISLVLVVVRSKKIRKSIGDIVLINLLISHAVEGVFAIWIEVAGLNFNITNTEKRALLVNLFVANSLLGCLNNLTFTADRVLAISWPYLHQRLKLRNVLMICCVPWLISCIFLSLAFLLDFSEETGDVITIILVSIMSLVLIVSNTIIYRVVLKHVKEITKTTVGIEYTVYENQDTSLENIHSIQIQKDITKVEDKPKLRYTENKIKSQHKKIEKKRLRSAYICSGIVASYIVCWLPHMIHDIIKTTTLTSSLLYSGNCYSRVTLFVAFLNPIIDPLIWASLNRNIRKEVKKQIRCTRKACT